ncbi:hypothetical protein [Ulvibacterium sp.]|uniref:hypothetical protein n=1 Tax=Ulvibacterium sp. TaxID=2665914 RepID=UPI003BABC0C7
MATLNWNGKSKKTWTLPGNRERKAKGILLDKKKGTIKILVEEHDNYNERYLRRKLLSAFKEEFDKELIVIYAFSAGDIIVTDRLDSAHRIGDIVTLKSGRNYYSSGIISCGGSSIDYPVKAKYTKKFTDRCHTGTLNKDYSKLIVVV